MNNDNLIVKIDESSFNRSVKLNYSWLSINKSSRIVNVEAQGRTTMIWALLSNGDWMWVMVDETVTSQDLWVFLYLLQVYIDTNFRNLRAEITLLLDNAFIHLTEETKRVAAKYNMKMLGLPSYWPHLAPVKFVFGFLKGSIQNSDQKANVDFSKRSWRREIVNSLKYLTKEKVFKMWKGVIQTAREIILEVYQRIRCQSTRPQLNEDADEE